MSDADKIHNTATAEIEARAGGLTNVQREYITRMIASAVADAGALSGVKEGDITLEDLGRAYMAGWRRGRGERSDA